ncbi:MAG TPA: hypothetical protein VGZ52_11705 [Acidimicrobiales bacterium]|jgi:hypothetical protein|nr:hypothetical protein [Acidimicrobiales bacterium]
MSEQSGGPGWWQASDGKWYPPDQAASVDPTTPQPVSGQAGPPPVYGGPPGAGPGTPPPYVPAAGAAAGGGGGAGKIIAIVVAVVLIAGGAAFALTRGGGSSGSTGDFCTNAKKLQNNTSLDKAFTDPTKVDQAVAAFDQLAKSAPSEIKADMNTINAS